MKSSDIDQFAGRKAKTSAVLPDLLCPGLKLVICGTSVGPRSASTNMYYAGKSNKFWGVLYETSLTPRKLLPREYKLLPEFGIGLTDLAKHAIGPDKNLGRGDFDVPGFREKLIAISPNVLAFNGKRAAKNALGKRSVGYGLQNERIGETMVYVLPSTSYKAREYWDIGYWQNCANHVLGI